MGRADRADIINLGSEWTSFSFVRNPWARLVSTYQDKAGPQSAAWRADRSHIQGFLDAGIPIDTDMTFAEFCEVICDLSDDVTEKHLRSQTKVLMHRGSPIVSYIGRVENIKEDWLGLMAHAGLNIELLHLNKSREGHYSRYYSDKALVKMVADRYADDIRIFNYDFDMAKL
ncbi:sulfotransferase family protein [bacterium]|nr:sulfotransferase family protein [bacterium]